MHEKLSPSEFQTARMPGNNYETPLGIGADDGLGMLYCCAPAIEEYRNAGHVACSTLKRVQNAVSCLVRNV